jgi:hypothetical protein
MNKIIRGFPELPRNKRINLGAIFFSFQLIGFLLAMWHGIGWYFLLLAIRRLSFESPLIYIPILRTLTNREIAEKEKERLTGNTQKLFVSTTSFVNFLVTLMMAILFFWKGNPTIIELVNLIFKLEAC